MLTYSNTIDGALANSVQTEVLSNDVGIAGYRHSLGYPSTAHFIPVNRVRDTDSDGIADHRDLDSDNDGLGDVAESGGIDADGDNLIDGVVDEQGVSVLANRDLNVETVLAVYQANSEVSGDDSDGDGLLSSIDPVPGQFGGALTSTDSDNDIAVDSDSDGFSDQQEIDNGTDPLVSDRVIVVMPTPVLVEPEPVQVPGPALGPAAPAIVPLVADDDIAANQASITTGLSGFAGCSIISMSAPLVGTKLDPGLPVMLMFALAGLTRIRGSGKNNA